MNAWGQPQSKNAFHKDSALGKSGMQKDIWERGNKAPITGEKSHSSSNRAWPTATSGNTASEGGIVGNNSGKKEKKTKIVLMSNK